MRKGLAVLFLMSLSAALLNWQVMAEDRGMKISITINDGKVITATMQDNQAAHDFVSLLPLTLNLREFAGTEKAS